MNHIQCMIFNYLYRKHLILPCFEMRPIQTWLSNTHKVKSCLFYKNCFFLVATIEKLWSKNLYLLTYTETFDKSSRYLILDFEIICLNKFIFDRKYKQKSVNIFLSLSKNYITFWLYFLVCSKTYYFWKKRFYLNLKLHL